MFRKSKGKIQLAEPLPLESALGDFLDSPFNPEDDAKNRLIDISSEEINENIFENKNNLETPVKRSKQMFKVKEPKIALPKYQKARVSVAENFTQSHRIWRKKSGRLLEAEPSPTKNPEYSKNQSSFIIFQSGYLNNFNNPENCHLSFEEGFNKTHKTRHPRNIMSLIKRKNIANVKQQNIPQSDESQNYLNSSRLKYKRNLSPTERITQSCEFKKDFQSISPIKITTNGNISSEQNLLQLRCTNPNFRNKKISNYIKMRASAVAKKDWPN